MLLKRSIETQLNAWAENQSHKCLVLRGARQVGKTWSSRRLGHEKFDSFIEINFLRTPELKNIFSGNLDIETLLLNISVYLPEAEFVPGKTLLLLDEIQECPEAVTSLKFWAEDGRFKVLATGSLLGIDYRRPTSYPVGSVEYLEMYALNFQEFLAAANISPQVISSLRHSFAEKSRVSDAVNDRMMALLRQYMVVGGMPEAVSAYFEKNSLSEADAVQRRILTDYRYDIAHYASADVKIKAEACYFSLPDQISKENHKFQYSVVEKGASARKYGSSIDWLEQADLLKPCYNLKALAVPLQNHRDPSNYRLYTTDIGLLTGMFDYTLKARLLAPDDSTLSGYTKGGIYEALVADLLLKNGHPLYFRRNEQSTFEIEFLLEKPEGIIPIEVKSGRSRSRSLDNLLKKEEIPYGFKLTAGNVGVSGKKITLPLYMAMFL